MEPIGVGMKENRRDRLLENFWLLRWLFELFVIVILLFLANRRAWYCFFILDDREYYCEYGNASSDFFWWGVIVVAITLLVLQRGLIKEFLARWKANWPLLIFIVYSILSLTWTVNKDRSLHTVYIMIAASVSAAGLATIYSRDQIFRLLIWFVGFVALASLIAVILLPKTAITQVFYLAGTWRGLFWHKNYLGSVMAFGNGLFLFSLSQGKTHYKLIVFSSFLYLLTLFLVIMSQSGTGLITLILLNGLIAVYFAWLKWRKLLSRRFYISLATLFVLLIGGVFLNLGPLFALIGKHPTLTGRVPLWQYLLRDVVSKRPWFGYGWETVWYDRDFQVVSGKTAGWGIIAVNSHSGYMDVLVYLGVAGLLIFLLVIALGLIRTLQDALHPESAYSFMPLLILAYVLIANTTISYFLEFESFHWVLLVLVLFMTSDSFDLWSSSRINPARIKSNPHPYSQPNNTRLKKDF
jgi:exopolysaccharide production protein ExoQ